MFGGIDPKKMKAMMKQMGIKQEDIEATEVVIKKSDGTSIIIDNPSVTKVVMQGQESWQISGEAHEEMEMAYSEEDIKLVMEKTGKTREKCEEALERNDGDMAQTIIDLSQN